jgi:hypothetical protein
MGTDENVAFVWKNGLATGTQSLSQQLVNLLGAPFMAIIAIKD